jgi:hemolysin III
LRDISDAVPENSVPASASGYTQREEQLHSASHALGFLASLAGLVWLVLSAWRYGDGWRLMGGAAFGLGAMLMLGSSTLYHWVHSPQLKARLRAADHSAIYLLIAATYTPFTISVLRGPWGWSLFAVVWVMAATGIALRMSGAVKRRGVAAFLYLAMGWLVVVGFRQIAASLSSMQLSWMMAGGIAYTVGVPFYLWKKRSYAHVAWHVFVLAGVACHFVAILSLMHAPGR